MAKTEFTVGELIENRYRVLTVIGTGGMGTLYQVSDEAHHDGAREGEIVALKTVRLRGSAAEAAESVERFQREFQLLTQLRHPNLVSVYDYGITTEGELYFTMEWVEGEDLEPSKHPLEPGATIAVMVQVCRALAYLHARGVIHGDLKPHNVLVAGDAGDAGHAGDRRHRVKLVDFGVAHEVRSPADRAQYYTPGYAAPETRQPHPIDHRADLYSLGALWYALLVGEPPMFMPGAGKERLIRFALDEALERQSQIPAAMGAVIARLMATAPADRYGSANEVIEAVNQVTGSAYELETRETAGSYALRTHFVNRETEIEVLQTVWKQARSDGWKLVLVSGEAGVGKTRLVEELKVQAELEGARVVRGQCVESGGSAYHPWREVLRVLVRYVEGASGVMKQVGPVLATVLPELWGRDYMADLAPPAELDPQAARLRLNDGIVQMLRAAAGLRPTVVVIEDAHWADEATLELLRFLVRAPVQAGLLVCVTYRDDEVSAEHSLTTLAGERVQRVEVRRLSPDITTDLVCSMLGLETLPALLTERLQQTTGGNALFVQELIRSLAAEGEVLRRTVEGWQVDGEALRKARLPESIHQVVERRLGHLSAEARQVLRLAAVVGLVFWDKVVEEIGQLPRPQVRAALGEVLEQELVFERDTSTFEGGQEYMFTSPTVREVSYESVSREERRGYHSQAAAWLMARSDEEIGERLGLIAEHLERAGQTEQAAVYLRQAGEQAAAQFANAEAISYLSRALDLTPEDNQAERYALLLVREKVYDLQGAREVQTQDLAALKELAEALDDDAQQQAVGSRRTKVALRQAIYAYTIGDPPVAIAAAQEAIHRARAIQDMSSEAEGHQIWGRALWITGDLEAGRLQLERAMALARTAGMRRVEADSLRILGLAVFYQGDCAGSKVHFERALRIYRDAQHGDRYNESEVLVYLGSSFKGQGDYASAWTCYEAALHITREIGYRNGESLALNNLGDVSRFLGNYARARDYFEHVWRITREIGHPLTEFLAPLNLGLVFHHLGDNGAAQEHSQQALRVAQEVDSPLLQAYALTNLGHALMGLDRLVEAAAAYQQALDIRRELGQSHLAVESLAGLARVTQAQGDLVQAQAQVEEILGHLELGDNRLEGTEEPFRIHLTCYRVLRANRDPRAEDILETAHRLLQEQAARITDQELRRSFLENVPYRREIAREWASLS